MNLIQNLVLAGIILSFALLELASGRHRHFHATRDDTRLELFMFVALVAISQPLIFTITAKLCALAMPGQRGAWQAGATRLGQRQSARRSSPP